MALTALTGLAGCATTQQEAVRLQLNSARLRASELRLKVTRRNPEIRVENITLLTTANGSAIVVRVRNLARGPVTDLPISVGVLARARRPTYLNAAAGLDYFQTHLPAIPAGGTLTWVFTSDRSLHGSSRSFARVGLPVQPPLASPRTLPRIAVAVPAATSGPDLTLTVRNLSSIPQYQLPVYAVASRRGRYVAAGETTIAHLAKGASAALRVRLLGHANVATLTLLAPPTIFG